MVASSSVPPVASSSLTNSVVVTVGNAAPPQPLSLSQVTQSLMLQGGVRPSDPGANGPNTVYYVIPQKQLGQMGRPPASVGPSVSVMSSPSSQGGPRGTGNRDREKPVAIHIPERSGQNNILVTEAGKDSTT